MSKSIVWFDLETTGVNTVTDRIIEICLIKTDLEGNHIETFQTLVNPGRNAVMSPGAEEKHGISMDDLSEYEEFYFYAKEIYDFIGDSHLGGYNILYFDIPMLVEEFSRAGIAFNHRSHKVIDPFIIYTKYEPRNLESYYKRLTGKTLEGAHRAEADILATVEIFEKQKELYPISHYSIDELDDEVNDKRRDMVDLSGKLKFEDINGNRTIVFNFGKWKGTPFREVYEKDSRYIDWIIDKGEFAQETKIICRKLLNRMQRENDIEI